MTRVSGEMLSNNWSFTSAPTQNGGKCIGAIFKVFEGIYISRCKISIVSSF
jgi:hypothetical protein